MYDIYFDIELGRIKKRYGQIVSLNTDQQCAFDFADSSFVGTANAAAVFGKGGEEYIIPLTNTGNIYLCTFPAVLCSDSSLYSLTVIAYGTDAAQRFRSTTEYTGEILASGFTDNEYAPQAPAGFIDTVLEQAGQSLRPTGSIDITENGTCDVTQYAQAVVSVETYEDDLAALLTGMETILENIEEAAE